MSPDTVSVVVPAYNRAGTIAACLASVLGQSEPPLEVVVVDDGSTDATAEAAGSLGDPRVRLVRHRANLGANAARVTGIAHSRGDWVAFLDSDDAWRPTKLAAQMALLRERGPAYGLCATWFSTVDDDGRTGHGGHWSEASVAHDILSGNVLGTFSTVVVARRVLDEVGGPDPTLPSCQDWELFVRISGVTRLCLVPESLVLFRHGRDPSRISRDRAAVVAGHRAMSLRLAPRLAELPDGGRRARLALADRLADLGSLGGVTELARARRGLLGHPTDALAWLRLVVRAAGRERRHSSRLPGC